jgi:hypothetical protein
LLELIQSSGSITLAQTVDTVAGVTYSVSFQYHTWAVSGSGTSLTCSVNNGAATSWSPSLSVSTTSWTPFSGSFVASGSQTTFTCITSSVSYLMLNLDAFDIQC